MNMFIHEMRMNRRSVIAWSLSLAFVLIFFLSMFPTFNNNAEAFVSMINGFPETVRNAIGLSINTITTLSGFYAYIFLYISLCGAIQAMNYGVSMVSSEIRGKTADFLMTKPVSRTQILRSKLLAAITSIIITNIAYLIIALIMANLVGSGTYDQKSFLLISCSLFLIQLFFLILGTLVSTIFNKIKNVMSISLSTVFAFFIVDMFARTLNEEGLRYITPFQYFDTNYIIQNKSYDSKCILLELAIIILAISLSFVIYRKKDIDTI